MKLLLDANLSPEVARLLKEAGHDAIHVADIGLLTAADPEILQAAAKKERILLTADSDFGALLALGSLASPSVHREDAPGRLRQVGSFPLEYPASFGGLGARLRQAPRRG